MREHSCCLLVNLVAVSWVALLSSTNHSVLSYHAHNEVSSCWQEILPHFFLRNSPALLCYMAGQMFNWNQASTCRPRNSDDFLQFQVEIDHPCSTGLHSVIHEKDTLANSSSVYRSYCRFEVRGTFHWSVLQDMQRSVGCPRLIPVHTMRDPFWNECVLPSQQAHSAHFFAYIHSFCHFKVTHHWRVLGST